MQTKATRQKLQILKVQVSTQLKVYFLIGKSITTTVQHQMAGCQRGLILYKLATHGYNNVII